MPIMHRSICPLILSILTDGLFKNLLDLPIQNLYMTACLRMLWSGKTMNDGIFLKESIKGPIIEMDSLVTNNQSRYQYLAKIFSRRNFTTTLDSFVLVEIASTHLNM